MSWFMDPADFSLVRALAAVVQYFLMYGFLASGCFGFSYLGKRIFGGR